MVPGATPRGKMRASFHFDSHWMNTMYRCALAAVIVFAASLHATASAQMLRAFPPNTLRGAMVFGDHPTILLNGRTTQLAPGARVHSPDNMNLMTPGIVGAKMLVHYTLDLAADRVKEVWILTPDEAAVKPWPTTLDEAQAWSFDPNTRTWIKP
jgi:hypothetical protein